MESYHYQNKHIIPSTRYLTTDWHLIHITCFYADAWSWVSFRTGHHFPRISKSLRRLLQYILTWHEIILCSVVVGATESWVRAQDKGLTSPSLLNILVSYPHFILSSLSQNCRSYLQFWLVFIHVSDHGICRNCSCLFCLMSLTGGKSWFLSRKIIHGRCEHPIRKTSYTVV